LAVTAMMAVGVGALRADTTAKTHIHITMSELLASVAGSKGMGDLPQAFTDMDIVTQIKGQRGRIQMPDGSAAIVDLAKGQVILLDPKEMKYTVVTLAELEHRSRMHAVPPAGEAKENARLARFHFTSSFAPTGHTDTLDGVAVTESVGKLRVTQTPPNGGAPLPFGTVDMSFWTATPAGVMSSPQIAELQRFAQASGAVFGLQQQMASLLQRIPAGASQLDGFLSQVENTLAQQVPLKSEMQVFSPVGVKLAEAAAALKGVPTDDNVDPNAAVVQWTAAITSLSATTVPDSAFSIPAGYRLAPLRKKGAHKGVHKGAHKGAK